MPVILLRGRDGKVQGETLVDDEDYALYVQLPWHLNNGYARCWRLGEFLLLHREILGLVNGDRRRSDHINRDRLDNRRANLRVVPSDAANMQNLASRGGSSLYRGVTWDRSRGKWHATGMVSGKQMNLGRFDDEFEAALAAAFWRAENMPYSEEAAQLVHG